MPGIREALGHQLVHVVVVTVLDTRADPAGPQNPAAVANPARREAQNRGTLGRQGPCLPQPRRRLPEPLSAHGRTTQETPGARGVTADLLPRPPAHVRHDPALPRRPRQARAGALGPRDHLDNARHVLPRPARYGRLAGRGDRRRIGLRSARWCQTWCQKAPVHRRSLLHFPQFAGLSRVSRPGLEPGT